MARMRTLKPEFWDSPSTAQASLAARLLFLAMWNWADDSGRGTAVFKELEAFAFPNDDIRTLPRDKAGNSAPMAGTSPGLYRSFAEVCGDVAEAYGVQFYRVKSRPYYMIPSFKTHQAKDFRLTSKHPKEDEGEFFYVTSGNAFHAPVADLAEADSAGTSAHDAGNSAPMAGKRNTVIGEEGNRVIGDKDSSSDAKASDPGAGNSPDEFPDHVHQLCEYLADKIRVNGNKVGKVGKAWRQPMNRLVRLDGYGPDQIRQVIDWPQQNEFWQGNILSASKLREKFDQLKTRMFHERTQAPAKQTPMDRVAQTAQLGHALQAQQDQLAIGAAQ